MKKRRLNVREIAALGVCTALIFASQIGLSFAANIELVSLLFIIYGQVFEKKTFYIVYAFAFLEGMAWGFNPSWWTMYLYIWDIIVILAIIFKKNENPLFWAIVSGTYGLSFGFLGLLPIFVIGLGKGGTLQAGFNMAFSYWISGIPFDIRHCIGNFCMALVLYKPLHYLMKKIYLNIISR